MEIAAEILRYRDKVTNLFGLKKGINNRAICIQE